MTLSFKEQTPLFPNSEFAITALKKNKAHKSVFLGNAIDKNGKNSDLYLLSYPDGSINAILQYGSEDEAYSSGCGAFFFDVVDNADSALTTLYSRAIEIGELVEKEAVIAYSDYQAEKEEVLFLNSDYYKNLPSSSRFYRNLFVSDLSDDEEIEKIKAFDQSVIDYNNNYEAQHGSIPTSNSLIKKGYKVLDSVEEAQEFCSKDGAFAVVTYTHPVHLSAIAKQTFNY